MPRTADPRRAKLHHSYTVEEAADTMSVHPNTVRAWIARGLPVLDDRRPLLIRGADLRQFLTRQRRDRKMPTGPGRLYCLPCRAAKVPDGGMVDFRPMANGGGNLVGLCPDCERPIYRRVSERSLDTVCASLDVQRMPPATGPVNGWKADARGTGRVAQVQVRAGLSVPVARNDAAGARRNG